MHRVITVVGAAIERDGFILCTQRGGHGPLAGLWEFPGGKVDAGETPEQALQREIDEELRCTVRVGELIVRTDYEYDFGIVDLSVYSCSLVAREPTLTEHTNSLWLPPHRFAELEWAPADLPAVAVLTS